METKENCNYLKEILRPRTIFEKIKGFFPASFSILKTYSFFEFITFPPMIGTFLHTICSKILDNIPWLIIIPLAFLFSLVYLINMKKQLFFAYWNFHTIQRENIPKVVLTPATQENFNVYYQEKIRIENKIRPKFQSYFGNTEQGFTLIGSTCIKDIELAKPIHDIGVYWNSNAPLSQEFLNAMSELGYIDVGCSLYNNDTTSRRFIHKDTTASFGYEITICRQNSFSWMYDCLVFCEYLTYFKPERDLYEEIKRKNMDNNIIDYNEKKRPEMDELRAKSKDWKKNHVENQQRQNNIGQSQNNNRNSNSVNVEPASNKNENIQNVDKKNK